MASELARRRAAAAWCTMKTSGTEMDPALAESFAEIIDELISQPWLDNATNGQLLDELRARLDVADMLSGATNVIRPARGSILRGDEDLGF